MTPKPLLVVDGLHKTFPAGHRRGAREGVVAVEDVSFTVHRGETVGIVGESGCGKSTLARLVLRLIEPTGGTVSLDGVDLGALGPRELRRFRARMQMVFQDATATLDSRMTVQALVEEALQVHGVGDRRTRRDRAQAALASVGVPPEQLDRKPHGLSGGQRQRVGIARALAVEPELVVLDEPISAVDVSLQAQILNLLADLQEQRELTYILIVHDLAVAEHVCDRIVVLYLGQVMEVADAETLFRRPLHPYTVSLLSAVPVPDPEIEARRERIVLRGDLLDTERPTTGCVFRARCPVGRDREVCGAQRPPVRPAAEGHHIACHFPGELTPAATTTLGRTA
jgi:oligopeptide/dipeptide ABC transporter ATP-binding protein